MFMLQLVAQLVICFVRYNMHISVGKNSVYVGVFFTLAAENMSSKQTAKCFVNTFR